MQASTAATLQLHFSATSIRFTRPLQTLVLDRQIAVSKTLHLNSVMLLNGYTCEGATHHHAW